MNILYLTPDVYQTSRFAGGMGTKTHTLQNAWCAEHCIDIASSIDMEIAPFYDVIIIELLGLRNDGKFKERVAELGRMSIPKFVYGSDSEILRWSGDDLMLLQSQVTAWIPNMEWQARYFRDFGLPVTSVVYEPIDCNIFRPTNKLKSIVAGGAVSLEKRSDFFTELFTRLKAYPYYETVYLGSTALWGEHTALNYELEAELKAVTDVFHGTVPQAQVAAVLSKTAIGVLNPLYETCNRLDMEMMASGVARVCGPHICYDERPTSMRFTDVDTCIAALEEITEGLTELPAKEHADTARSYAETYFSFEATLRQLNSIIRSFV